MITEDGKLVNEQQIAELNSQLVVAHKQTARLGLVSQVTPVHTAVRNCTRDEGRSFEAKQSGSGLKPLQAAVVKSDGGERCGKVGTRFRQV